MNLLRRIMLNWRTSSAPLEAESQWAGRGTAPEQPRPRLVDETLETDLEAKGYAIVPGLLDRGEIESLTVLLAANDAEVHGRPFGTSLHSDDVDYRRAVDIGIRSVLDPKVEAVLNGYRLCFANFLMKSPVDPAVDDGEVRLHQDIAMVNEARFETLAIWVPLANVDEQNGCLRVVPGSHLYSDRLRWAGTTFVPEEDEEFLRERAEAVPLKAGDAMIFGPKLVHWSAPNRSRVRRAVVGGPMAPTAASMIYLHQDPASPDMLDVYSVQDDFYARHTYLDRPREADLVARIPALPTKRLRPAALERDRSS